MKPWLWAFIGVLVGLPIGILFATASIIGGIFGDSLIGNGFMAWNFGWIAGIVATIGLGLGPGQDWGRYAAITAAALQVVGVGVAMIDSQYFPIVVFGLPAAAFAAAGLIQEPEPDA